ncbi:MAG: 5-oxoprolinase subunit PxpA [Maribacter sp.]|uniref:5-oxoprolinase subunit PxpA n=1 Tax=Maribacter sp. TaxID=1897614 RepID=UPI003C7337E0
MEKRYIDINCDVGEGIGNEAGILPLVSSCNIACGGHTGDSTSMASTAKLAKEYGVHIGAHPSYPDPGNFGRISMVIDSHALMESIRQQIKTLKRILDEEHLVMHHIKPHGALYNDLVRDHELSDLFLNAIENYKDSVFLYAPFGSIIAQKAIEKGVKIKFEAFADRTYNPDLGLVSRRLPNAVLKEPQAVLDQLLTMVLKGKVMTVDGSEVPLQADTFCLHGDTPNALQILMYLSEELPKQQIYIKK